VRGQKYPFQKEDHTNVERDNLENVLDQTSVGSVVDRQSLSIGNTMVPDYLLNRLVYTGTATLNRMNLPIDIREYRITGRIKPDLVALDNYEKFKS
jgi:hypothetical protein